MNLNRYEFLISPNTFADLMGPNSEGRDVFPCDFCAKIDFFALNDCLCVIIMKNDGVQLFDSSSQFCGLFF